MIPESVNIGGHEVKIEIEDDVKVYHPMSGYAMNWQNLIKLAKNQDDGIKETSLSHEILHEMINKSGIWHELKENDLEETLVCGLENIFWRFLKDNTDFFKNNETLMYKCPNCEIDVTWEQGRYGYQKLKGINKCKK